MSLVLDADAGSITRARVGAARDRRIAAAAEGVSGVKRAAAAQHRPRRAGRAPDASRRRRGEPLLELARGRPGGVADGARGRCAASTRAVELTIAELA